MTEFLMTMDNCGATFRDYLTQPAFAEEFENFVTAGSDTGMFDYIDTDFLLDGVLNCLLYTSDAADE